MSNTNNEDSYERKVVVNILFDFIENAINNIKNNNFVVDIEMHRDSFYVYYVQDTSNCIDRLNAKIIYNYIKDPCNSFSIGNIRIEYNGKLISILYDMFSDGNNIKLGGDVEDMFKYVKIKEVEISDGIISYCINLKSKCIVGRVKNAVSNLFNYYVGDCKYGFDDRAESINDILNSFILNEIVLPVNTEYLWIKRNINDNRINKYLKNILEKRINNIQDFPEWIIGKKIETIKKRLLQ